MSRGYEKCSPAIVSTAMNMYSMRIAVDAIGCMRELIQAWCKRGFAGGLELGLGQVHAGAWVAVWVQSGCNGWV